MENEEILLSRSTRIRDTESVIKIGYADGAADGQQAVFQESFDLAYEEGLDFGLKLGLFRAMQSHRGQESFEANHFVDPQKVNCQLCIDGTLMKQQINNLLNLQKQSNSLLLDNICRNCSLSKSELETSIVSNCHEKTRNKR